MSNTLVSIDKLCQDCDALFDQHTVGIILNKPGARAQGLPKKHLKYQMLRISAQACHLCEVILDKVLLLLENSARCKEGNDDKNKVVYIVATAAMLSLYAGDAKLRYQDMVSKALQRVSP